MTKWPVARLGEFCVTGSGGTPSRGNRARYYDGGTIPWVKSGELRESLITETSERVTRTALAETSTKLVPAGAILLAMYGATIGRLGLLGVPAATNQAVCHIIPDPKAADTRYLFHALRSQVNGLIGRGAGGAQPNISQAIVKEIEIVLPPVAEQQRIAGIIDQTLAVRGKRLEAINGIDELTQATFVEMFGDPGANQARWPQTALADVCVIRGEYGAGVASQPFDPALPRYIRITDLIDGGELKADRVSPSGSHADWETYRLEEGDILFARSGATVGKTYLHKSENGYCVFAGYLIRFRSDVTRVVPRYVFEFTQTTFYRSWVAARQRVVAQPNINAKQYGHELLLPLPPLSLQSAFAARVDAFHRLRERYRAHAAELDHLVASVQHRAFRGEL